MKLEWAGFKPLRAGHIHIFCPKCRRRLSNIPKLPTDPPNATLCHSWCLRCSQGCKECPEYFFDHRGKRIYADDLA